MNKTSIAKLIIQTVYRMPMCISFLPALLIMQPATWVWVLSILTPAMVFTPVWLCFAKPFNKYAIVPSYKLPNWLFWFSTPDELIPGDVDGEPTVSFIYEHTNWFITGWYNLGIRNVMHGALWNDGFEVPKYLHQLTDKEKLELGVIDKQIDLGIFVIKFGHQVYKDIHGVSVEAGKLWAAPRVTIRPIWQD